MCKAVVICASQVEHSLSAAMGSGVGSIPVVSLPDAGHARLRLRWSSGPLLHNAVASRPSRLVVVWEPPEVAPTRCGRSAGRLRARSGHRHRDGRLDHQLPAQQWIDLSPFAASPAGGTVK